MVFQVVTYNAKQHMYGAIDCLQTSSELHAYQSVVDDLVRRLHQEELEEYHVKVAIKKGTIVGVVVYMLGDPESAVNSSTEYCFIHECCTLPVLSASSRQMCTVYLLDAVRDEAWAASLLRK